MGVEGEAEEEVEGESVNGSDNVTVPDSGWSIASTGKSERTGSARPNFSKKTKH